jgi:O-succinylbenzoic acid--CoA ligase
MPLAHVGGLSIVTRCLIARRTVVLSPSFDAEQIRAILKRERITLCSFVPTMLLRLLEDANGWRMPATVRAILLGGAGAPAKLLAIAQERSLNVLTTYGLTEACSQVTTQRYGTRPSPEEGSGSPVLGTEVRIHDGRIHVRGGSLMTGYFPVGAHVAPFTDDGWFRTEDYGRIDEQGRLHVLGRSADLIVTGGENVYPLEVEREIERTEGVQASCVFGLADDVWGQIVCVAVVSDQPLDELRAKLAQRLATTLASHKRPRRIALVKALRATAAGKLDRAATAAEATPKLVSMT